MPNEQAPSVIRDIEEWRTRIKSKYCYTVKEVYEVETLTSVLTLLRNAAADKKVRDAETAEKRKIALINEATKYIESRHLLEKDRAFQQGYMDGRAKGYSDGRHDADTGYQTGYGNGYAAGRAQVYAQVETLLKEKV